ncbi:MAG: lamin tail domain-containing protein, partial [Patescibacteria group bacterium]|nr:lamin tail domain-containing protein [Patescibacteria group bacterium]
MSTGRSFGNIVFPSILLIFVLAFFADARPARADIADHAVINEAHIDSVSGAGGHEDDWVELYNPTDADILLDGWSVQKTNVDGGSFYNQALSGTIPAGGYFLIVRDGSATQQSLKDMADVLGTNSFLLATNFSIYLVNNSDDISSTTNPYIDSDIVDSVGYGNAMNYEGAAAAPDIPETKSISRYPEGEDTDDNLADFVILDTPTPQNSSAGASDNNLEGQVLLTITPDIDPVQNISAAQADIVFQVNADGNALVHYGLSESYGSTTAEQAFTANTDTSITLDNLQCGAEYHYSIYAENTGGTESDQTVDAVFTILPCGIVIDSLTMVKSGAKANNDYPSGWEWEFNLTIWNMTETSLKMKFDAWSGNSALAAADNMQFSVDGSTWHDITGDGVYPSQGADISGIDLSTDEGRQVI